MANEKRLIDANELIQKHGSDITNWDKPCAVYISSIENAPTVDAEEVVYGQWVNPYINRYGHPCHCCSVCGFKASYQDKNYCPQCGANMDGGNEE